MQTMNPNIPIHVSVIMPVRNEAQWIERSLRAVLEQDYPVTLMEIILVDGCSDDGTLALVHELPNAVSVCILTNPRRIQATGLNEALKYAIGDVIVRVDGHTLIATDYVRRCVETLRETQADCVGGSLNPVGISLTGRAVAAVSKSFFFVPAHFRVGRTASYTDTVYMGAWPRRVFDVIGGFDEALVVNEDYEFNYRLRQAGGKIYYTPDIQSHYFGPQTLVALARQYARYGYWKSATLAKHPLSLRIRHLAAPTFVAFILLGALLAAANPISARWWLTGLFSYLLLTSTATLRYGFRAPFLVALRIPLIFFIVHFAWGVGLWAGIFRLLARVRGRNLP